uniref:Uncharacterized protein n=1 Tax=Acrobeloides nanus TaxID=290746 RepID=A0A914C8Y1_9BILA
MKILQCLFVAGIFVLSYGQNCTTYNVPNDFILSVATSAYQVEGGAREDVESLKQELVKAWDEITVETLAKIVDNFSKRLKACIEANGGHFE